MLSREMVWWLRWWGTWGACVSEEIKGKWDTGLGQVGGCRPGRENNRYIWWTEGTPWSVAKLEAWRKTAEDRTRKISRGLMVKGLSVGGCHDHSCIFASAPCGQVVRGLGGEGQRQGDWLGYRDRWRWHEIQSDMSLLESEQSGGGFPAFDTQYVLASSVLLSS